MATVPSGTYTLHTSPNRLELTIPGALYGESRFVFDNDRRVLERDGSERFSLNQVTGVEVQTMWTGPGNPYHFMVAIIGVNATEHVWVDPSKQKAIDLAEAIATFLGVGVSMREQAFQRSARKKIQAAFGTGPGGTGEPGSAVQAVTTLGLVASSLFQLFGIGVGIIVGLGFVSIGLRAASDNLISLGIGAAILVFSLVGLARLVLRIVRTARVRPAMFALDGRPEDANVASPEDVSVAGVRPAAVATEAEYTPAQPVSLWTLISRSYLLVFLLPIGLGAAGLVGILTQSPMRSDATMGLLISAGIFGVGVWLFVRALRTLQRWSAIQRNAEAVEAMVLEVKTNGIKVNRQPRYAVHYRYHDQSGVEHVGQSHSLTPAQADRWRQFDIAEVFYNRERPQDSMLAGTRPMRRSSREERQVDGDAREPSRWPQAAATPDRPAPPA